MFEINKCIRLKGSFPKVPDTFLRYSCNEKCPPSYECKQPEPNKLEKEVQELRRLRTPGVFQKKCPKNYKIYRNLFFFVCLPAIVCLYADIAFLHPEEHRRPKFVEFSYLRIRNKEFPWDPVRSLFHNPRYNALPTGYEVEVPEEEEVDPFENDKKA